MKIIWHWLILSGAVLATTYIFPDKIVIDPWYIALAVGALLMFMNTVIRPILGLLTLPINILTLGLFGIVLNGLMLWIVMLIIPAFFIDSFLTAILGALIISVINWILDKVF